MARTYRRRHATHLTHARAPLNTPAERARFHADRPLPARCRYQAVEFSRTTAERRDVRQALHTLAHPDADLILPVRPNRNRAWDYP